MADVKARLEQMLKDDHASGGGGVTNEQLKEQFGDEFEKDSRKVWEALRHFWKLSRLFLFAVGRFCRFLLVWVCSWKLPDSKNMKR